MRQIALGMKPKADRVEPTIGGASWGDLSEGAQRLAPGRPNNWAARAYSLGEWSNSEEFKSIARKERGHGAGLMSETSVDWEANGANTYARRRGGLTPETSVREVETE